MHDDEFRRQMPIAERFAYFDHAAVAPLPRATGRALTQFAEEGVLLGDTAWPRWAAAVEQLRELVARLINATTHEVALVPNTTVGINLVAEGFPWREGDNVVVPANEFPSNLFPWMNLAARGVEVRPVEPRDGVEVAIDDLLAAADGRTRLIAVSWVGYATGWRIAVDELVARAHERGILVFLDAIQGLGVFPLDVAKVPVDFLAADGHKWMLGPEGAGVFYLRREHLDLLRPLLVGWHSVPKAVDFSQAAWQPKPEAQRYEGGSQNMVGMLGLKASLELLAERGLSAGASRVADHVLAITDYACQRLAAAGAETISRRDTTACQSGIVAFRLPGRESAEVRKQLWDRDVIVSVRNGWVRIAAHAYNSTEDVDRLISALP